MPSNDSLRLVTARLSGYAHATNGTSDHIRAALSEAALTAMT